MPFQNDGLVLNLHPLVHQWNSAPAVAVLCSVTSPSTGQQSCHLWVGRVLFQWFLESSSRVSRPGAIKLQDKFMEHLQASPAFPATTLPKMYQPHVWHKPHAKPPIKMAYTIHFSIQHNLSRSSQRIARALKGKNIPTTSSNDILKKTPGFFSPETLPWVILEVWWCSNKRGSMPGRMRHWLCRPEAYARFSCFIRGSHGKLGKSFHQSRPETKSAENSAVIPVGWISVRPPF